VTAPAVPSPAQLRAELEELITRDLYGPVGGETEQLAEASPRDRYLVGMLAPVGTVAVDPARNDGATAHEAEPDGVPEDRNAQPALFPSSKGLSFAVLLPAGGGSVPLRVGAWWGRYQRVEVAAAEPGGTPATADAAASPAGSPAEPGTSSRRATPPPRPAIPSDQATPGTATHGAAVGRGSMRVWQREPRGGEVLLTVPAAGGTLGPLTPDAAQPGVVVRGRAVRHEDALLVSLFLVNQQAEPKRNKDAQWLFQAELTVTGEPADSPVFVGRDSVLRVLTGSGSEAERLEVAGLDLLYRRRVEFAVGHGTAVHAEAAAGDPYRAVRLATVSLPRFEVARTEAPRPGEPGFEGLAAAVLDMHALAEADDAALVTGLRPLVDAYRAWLRTQAARASTERDLASHTEATATALQRAGEAADRLEAGIALLEHDGHARDAFRFANWAMWQQRVHTLAAQDRDEAQPLDAAVAAVDQPGNRSWRPFQLAFLLLNLPSLTDPAHSERTSAPLVDLLFFPTGGGKTEAYLGLTAYTFAIRRLQGDRFGLSGHDGVAVLMRYTLRLLTAQQFQRAAALVAACEVRRRQLRATGDSRWGEVPFRIGLWVGGSVTPIRSATAQKVVAGARSSGWGASGASPLQLVACPWCGSRLALGSDVTADPVTWRTLVYCSDRFGGCPFTAAGEQRDGVTGEGIPVVTVDEEIYRLLPSLLIATVDKFAQLPWQGPLHLLFGRTARRCTRHGYRSPDLDEVGQRKEADTHNASGAWPRAHTVDVPPLRPPDLVIQDELHLIAGPLGTMVGLYETAIDRLATWDTGGVAVRAKVIASTATVRRAADQVHALFARGLAVFPPPVVDVEDNFFSVQRDPAATTGRLYLGVCGFGQRLKNVETRVFITVLAAGQRLFDRYGDAADPWLTMIGYFNALRELAGARRLVDDDVRSRLPQAALRGLGDRRLRIVEELTSRVSSADIPATLDQLAVRFTVEGEQSRAAARGAAARTGKARPKLDGYRPIDVLLATNMISVGVDVSRLGLMVAVGQPKATAEYIQATSRVGRSDAGPGLVLTVYNWARPRDLSHYESFEHYHATFYRHVEAMSVTPFAERAQDRGLTGLLVALVRHLDPAGTGAAWNPDRGAQVVPAADAAIDAIVAGVAARAADVDGHATTATRVRDALEYRRDRWAKRQHAAAASGSPLAYRGRGGAVEALLHQPVPGGWDEWTVPNSLRETEPDVNLLVDLWDTSLDHAAGYQRVPAGDEAAAGGVGAGEPVVDGAASLTADDRDEDEVTETGEEG
jgi:hypothetical protein